MQTVTVSKGADSVDFALVNRLAPGDVVITQDYGLAAMCLAKRAKVLHQDGMRYSPDNIDALLLARHTAGKSGRRAAGCGAAPKGSRSRTEPSRKRWSGCCPRASQNEAAAGALAQPLMENPDIPILDVKNQEPAYSVE